jgi:hypothetical protein
VGENLNITGFLGSATIAVGVAWGVGEFRIDRFFGTHEQMDMYDTMTGLLVDIR